MTKKRQNSDKNNNRQNWTDKKLQNKCFNHLQGMAQSFFQM
jgi:hypothetical protein